jgi:hypothetical protein
MRRKSSISSMIAAGMFCLAFTVHAQSAEPQRNHPPLPDYLVPFKDPVSGLTTVRITKPGKLGNGVKCSSSHCGHRYSSAQVWNADQSLLLLASGCGGLCFLDGQSYQPLFHRPQTRDCEWTPDEPSLMICVGERDISFWNPRTDKTDVLYAAEGYHDLEFGPGKGNSSLDGARIAVRALREDGMLVVFAFDLKARRKYEDIDLDRIAGENSYCSISPSGENIVCFQSVHNGDQHAFIFGVDGRPVQAWQENHRPGHGDIVADAEGDEYLIGVSKSAPDKYKIIKRRLSDGFVVALMEYGTATHVSTRSTQAQDWAIVSYEGDPEEVAKHPRWAPYARQIIALAVDGSGEVIKIAQTNNVKTDYHSEAHGSASPDGSQIIWSSNWGVPGGPVYDFVTRLPAKQGRKE